MSVSRVINPHYIDVPRKARFYVAGCQPQDANKLWLVFHGYGQLARYFVRHFEWLASQPDTCIVAPEGLSRFYLDSSFQRVGASWMTREDRELEIDEQFTYIETLIDSIAPEGIDKLKTFVVLGFSQGVPTAWRWLDKTRHQATALILWAGMMLEQQTLLKKKSETMSIAVATGSDDPYLTTERLETFDYIMKRADIPFERFTYQGGHTIDTDTLKRITTSLSLL